MKPAGSNHYGNMGGVMPINDMIWILVLVLLVVPVLLVLGGRILYRKQPRLSVGIGSAIFVILCWATALSVILYRIGAFD